MQITVTIDPKNKYPLDPTSSLDYCLLIFCVIVSIVLIGGSLVVLRKRKFAPLKALGIKKLVLMNAMALVHIWAAFIANEHFPILHMINYDTCIIWTFWLQYTIGSGTWFSLFVIRLLDYGYTFTRRMRGVLPHNFRFLKIVVVAVIILPIWMISIGVALLHGSQYSQERKSCSTDPEWKVLLLIWYIICSVIIISFLPFFWLPNNLGKQVQNLYRLVVYTHNAYTYP